MLADDIREFVFAKYIKPARQSGVSEVRVRAGDIHKEMGLSQRLPAVCAAIGAQKFEKQYGILLVNREGPANGCNAYFTFKLAE